MLWSWHHAQSYRCLWLWLPLDVFCHLTSGGYIRLYYPPAFLLVIFSLLGSQFLAFLMSTSVSVCPSNEWIFSSSTAAGLQLTQRESLLVSCRKWNTAHLLQITAAVLSLAVAVSRLEVHVEEMSQTVPSQTQLAALCAWQMTYVLNLARKAEINSAVSQTFGLIKCLLSWLHGDTQTGRAASPCLEGIRPRESKGPTTLNTPYMLSWRQPALLLYIQTQALEAKLAVRHLSLILNIFPWMK